jgi:hypothetical protein
VEQSVLNRGNDFRQVMEQKELIERALSMQDDELSKLWNTIKRVGTPDNGLYIEKKGPKREPYAIFDLLSILLISFSPCFIPSYFLVFIICSLEWRSLGDQAPVGFQTGLVLRI